MIVNEKETINNSDENAFAKYFMKNMIHRNQNPNLILYFKIEKTIHQLI